MPGQAFFAVELIRKKISHKLLSPGPTDSVELIVAQFVKNFSALYASRSFIL
jgi:hypothetical protein